MTGLAEFLAPGHELLDDRHADPALVRASLENIARSNRLFGGVAAARYGVDVLLAGQAGQPGHCSLLDVGTGAGDLPRALGRSLGRRGITVHSIGVELNATAARLATEGGLATILADGLRLPLADRSVDIVLLSQIAHHLSPRGIVTLAAEATRVARLGVVLSDLIRSRFAAVAFAVTSRLLRFDPATQADGVTSLRRGFHPARLEALLRHAGIPATCVRRPGWRVLATWRVTPR